MKCPFCGAADTQVVDSRVTDEGISIRRRRRCNHCEKRFTTFETAELRLPQVIKQNGQREDFSDEKLRQSVLRPLHKRPVPMPLVESALREIRQQILARGEREIASRFIGGMVMHALQRLDEVAYIRFASVYRSFQDVDDFSHAIREVKRQPPPPSEE